MDSRGVTPVVEKAVTIGIVVLFVGGVTTTLFGGTVPGYRDAVGEEVGHRVLAAASQEVERAVPPNATHVTATRTVDLPATIRGAGYRIRADGRSLRLDHPRVSAEPSRLALPPSVVRVNGTWESGATTVVAVRSVPGGLAVDLREATP